MQDTLLNVKPALGVIIRSTGGSSAKLRNIATFFMAPVSSKLLRKKAASSCSKPIAMKTM